MRRGDDPAPAARFAAPPASQAPEHASPEGHPSSITPPPATLPVPSEPRAEQKAAETLDALGRASFSAKLRFGAGLVRDALRKFQADEAFTRGAALAYYTVLSLAPLLLVVVAVAGLAFGADAVRTRILTQIAELAGPDAAQTIGTLMRKASKPSSGVLAAIVGVGSLLIGAGGVFGYLQKMLNKVWGVPEKASQGILHAIRTRFLSLAMVLGTGFLLLVSLVVSAALSAVGDRIGRQFSSGVGIAFNAANQVVSWAIVGLLFALIFRFLPDTRIAWRDVWIGAGLTSLLFVAGQFLIGLYLGRGSVASVYGGAGSIVIVLLWTYYSGLILFFGAEVTAVFASRWGSRKGARTGKRETGNGIRRETGNGKRKSAKADS